MPDDEIVPDDQSSPPPTSWAMVLLPIFVAIFGVLYAWSLTSQSRREPGVNAMRLVEERDGRALREQLRTLSSSVMTVGWRVRRVTPDGPPLFVVNYTIMLKDDQGRLEQRLRWWEVNLDEKSVREVTGNRELEVQYQRLMSGPR